MRGEQRISPQGITSPLGDRVHSWGTTSVCFTKKIWQPWRASDGHCAHEQNECFLYVTKTKCSHFCRLQIHSYYFFQNKGRRQFHTKAFIVFYQFWGETLFFVKLHTSNEKGSTYICMHAYQCWMNLINLWRYFGAIVQWLCKNYDRNHSGLSYSVCVMDFKIAIRT
jgi:hypothetical protein